MKRCWIGLILLVVLLAASLLVTWAMDRIHEPIARELEQAAEAALDEDWAKAMLLAGNSGTQWRKWAHFRACFADHAPMEEIDAMFAQLEVYAAAEENAAFAASCAETARKVEAVGEAHGFVWWNLL